MLEKSLIKFDSFNTRQNLPSASSAKRGELLFGLGFIRRFLDSHYGHGVGGREFPMSGYGTTDFLWVDFPLKSKKLSPENLRITSFEFKLDNWRKALMQAYRYSYFSNRSIVILPQEIASRAAYHSEVFEHLGVGLWSFGRQDTTIKEIYTPEKTSAKNPKAREKVIETLSTKVKFRKFCEQSNALL